MMAILHDAIDCVEKYRFATDTHRQRLFYEAKQWLLADETDWPYSFECICGVLGLDGNAVRQRLRVGDGATREFCALSTTPTRYRREGKWRNRSSPFSASRC